MWMMGYNEGGADPVNGAGRKLRPLIPRLSSSSSTKPTDVFSLSTHLGNESKREAVVVSSSRWNPTPEQLRVLEDLYRRGTRTPTADQIQQITSQLRRYGKIEGKNVFYWFQNHKARERQKRRRQMESSSEDINNSNNNNHDHEQQHLINLALSNHGFDKKDPEGSSRSCYEVEQKNWIYSTPCTTQPEHHQATVTRGRATMAVMAGDCRAENRWVHLHGGGDDDALLLQTSTTDHRINFLGRNATWQRLQLPPSPTHHPLILNSTTVSSISTTSHHNTVTLSCPSSAKATVAVPVLPSHPQVFFSSRTMVNTDHHHHNHQKDQEQHHQDCCGDGDESHDHTLQLFPLRKEKEEEEECGNGIDEEPMNEKMTEKVPEVEVMNGFGCFSPIHRFYEFLPLKN